MAVNKKVGVLLILVVIRKPRLTVSILNSALCTVQLLIGSGGVVTLARIKTSDSLGMANANFNMALLILTPSAFSTACTVPDLCRKTKKPSLAPRRVLILCQPDIEMNFTPCQVSVNRDLPVGRVL